jgi:hypothetical protein
MLAKHAGCTTTALGKQLTKLFNAQRVFRAGPQFQPVYFSTVQAAAAHDAVLAAAKAAGRPTPAYPFAALDKEILQLCGAPGGWRATALQDRNVERIRDRLTKLRKDGILFSSKSGHRSIKFFTSQAAANEFTASQLRDRSAWLDGKAPHRKITLDATIPVTYLPNYKHTKAVHHVDPRRHIPDSFRGEFYNEWLQRRKHEGS